MRTSDLSSIAEIDHYDDIISDAEHINNKFDLYGEIKNQNSNYKSANEYRKLFPCSPFDPPKAITAKTLSQDQYDHLNNSTRTKNSKGTPATERKSSQETNPQKKIRISTLKLKSYGELNSTPAEELQNRRKLADYMKKATKDTKVKHWDAQYKDVPVKKQNIYEGPQKRPKTQREPKAFIDRTETRSVKLRNQSVRQKLSMMKEIEKEKEMEDLDYSKRVYLSNKEITPYLKYLDSLEEIPQGGVEEKQKVKRKEDRDRAIKPLKESIEIVKEAPAITIRECVFTEIRSEMNKINREEINEKLKEEKELYESRGKFKSKCFELWNPDANH